MIILKIPFLRTVLAGAILTAAVSAAVPQSSNPAWLENLSHQLAAEKQCQVDYYVNVREGKLGGWNTYDARAQCRDGRQFDASKIDPAEKFAIRPCQIVVC